MAKALSFCNLLDKVGKNLTRARLMAAARNFTETNKIEPVLPAGRLLDDGGNDNFPISAARLIQYQNSSWKPIGELINPRPSKTKK